jgi:DnaJ-class molecular chaperone
MNSPTQEEIKRSYEILGLQPYVTVNDIKRAYRKKATGLNLNKNTGQYNLLGEDFKKITEAYNVLME